MNLKDLEGSGRDLIEALCQNLPTVAEKSYEKLPDIQCSSRDPNQAPTEYHSAA
jgi:hypothetical protein